MGNVKTPIQRPASAFRRACALLVLNLAFLPATQAALLAVDWGGNTVSADAAFSSQGGFSSGDPLLISPTTGYTGKPFYGYTQIFSGTVTNIQNAVGNATNDRIVLKMDNGTTNTGFLVLWKQTDFLNGLNTGNVGFDAASSIRTNIISYASQDANDSGRIVIRSGGSYYISSRIYSNTGNITTPDVTALPFYAYNPATTLDPNNPTTPVSIVSGGFIQNVTEVGFYFETNATLNNALRIEDFEVNLTAIPEPGSILVFSLLAPLALAFRRR